MALLFPPCVCPGRSCCGRPHTLPHPAPPPPLQAATFHQAGAPAAFALLDMSFFLTHPSDIPLTFLPRRRLFNQAGALAGAWLPVASHCVSRAEALRAADGHRQQEVGGGSLPGWESSAGGLQGCNGMGFGAPSRVLCAAERTRGLHCGCRGAGCPPRPAVHLVSAIPGPMQHVLGRVRADLA